MTSERHPDIAAYADAKKEGGSVTPEVEAHVQSCNECQTTLEHIRTLEEATRRAELPPLDITIDPNKKSNN